MVCVNVQQQSVGASVGDESRPVAVGIYILD